MSGGSGRGGVRGPRDRLCVRRSRKGGGPSERLRVTAAAAPRPPPQPAVTTAGHSSEARLAIRGIAGGALAGGEGCGAARDARLERALVSAARAPSLALPLEKLAPSNRKPAPRARAPATPHTPHPLISIYSPQPCRRRPRRRGSGRRRAGGRRRPGAGKGREKKKVRLPAGEFVFALLAPFSPRAPAPAGHNPHAFRPSRSTHHGGLGGQGERHFLVGGVGGVERGERSKRWCEASGREERKGGRALRSFLLNSATHAQKPLPHAGPPHYRPRGLVLPAGCRTARWVVSVFTGDREEWRGRAGARAGEKRGARLRRPPCFRVRLAIRGREALWGQPRRA